jgi:predicted ATPase
VLCERLGDTPEIAQALWGLWTFSILRAELTSALAIARDLLQFAERLKYPGMEMRGHWAMGITLTHRGDCAAAVEHLERALALYEPDRHRDDGFLYALNPSVAMRSFLGWAYWFLGRPDQALTPARDAVALARELADPHGLTHALLFAATLHQLRRERRAAHGYAEEAANIAAEHGLALYHAMATIVLGWARVELQGYDEAPLTQMRRGLAAWEATGAHLMRPYSTGLMVDAMSSAGDVDEALRLLEDALATAHGTGEGWYDAELLRLKGERLLARGRRDASAVAAAAHCFDQSLSVARTQNARSLELRTAMSLVRFSRDYEKAHTAVNLISPILERFTEGLDTADLLEARALVDAETTA